MNHVLYKTFEKSAMKSDEEDHRVLLLSDFCIRGRVGAGGLWLYLFITYSKETGGEQRQRVVRGPAGEMVPRDVGLPALTEMQLSHENLKVVWPAVLISDMVA